MIWLALLPLLLLILAVLARAAAGRESKRSGLPAGALIYRR
jgi:hypothetical protein